MIEPEPRSTSRIPAIAAAEEPQTRAIAEVNPFNFAAIQQTVLKLPTAISLQPSVALPVTLPVLEAMQRLVKVIAKLRSPGGGCPPDLRPSPENLAPYVQEEAYEVLESLRSEERNASRPTSILQPSHHFPFSLTTTAPISYLLVADLIPRLLFWIARSSYAAMQLVEGIQATVYQPGDHGESGMLRLSVSLEAKATTNDWIFDLATHQPLPTRLAADAVVQSDESYVCKQRDRIENLLKRLTESIRQITPEASQLMDGVAVELLTPRQAWQLGTVQLRIGFEFISAREAAAREAVETEPIQVDEEDGDDSISLAAFADGWTLVLGAAAETTTSLPDVEIAAPETAEITLQDLSSSFGEPAALPPPVPTPPPPSVQPSPPKQPDRPKPRPPSVTAGMRLRVTDRTARAKYARIAVQQQLTNAISRLQPTASTSETDLVAQIIQQAYEMVDRLQALTALKQFSLLQSELTVDELIPRLLWHLTSSAYEVMPLIGGVQAKILQPNQGWLTGSLRLIATLKIRTSALTWNLDLATGQPAAMNAFVLEPAAIARIAEGEIAAAPESPLCSQLLQVSSLEAHLVEQIRTSSPEISLLIKSMPIELKLPEQDWQSATFWLSINLGFIPDTYPRNSEW